MIAVGIDRNYAEQQTINYVMLIIVSAIRIAVDRFPVVKYVYLVVNVREFILGALTMRKIL